MISLLSMKQKKSLYIVIDHVLKHLPADSPQGWWVLRANAFKDSLLDLHELLGNGAFGFSPGVREIHAHQTVVLWVAAAHDQTGLFHALKHIGHSRALHGKLLGDVGLRHAILNKKPTQQGCLGA